MSGGWPGCSMISMLDICHCAMAVHSEMGSETAAHLGASARVAHAILTHNEAHGMPLESRMDEALFCSDPLTGLITACALARPDRKLASVSPSSVIKLFGEKRFAAGANREQIGRCIDLGLLTEDFISLGLRAMQSIAPDLGL